MSGQSIHHHRWELCLNERANIMDQFIRHVSTVIRDPLQRHFLLDICDLMHVLTVCSTDIRVLWDTVQHDHLSGLTLKRSLDSRIHSRWTGLRIYFLRLYTDLRLSATLRLSWPSMAWSRKNRFSELHLWGAHSSTWLRWLGKTSHTIRSFLQSTTALWQKQNAQTSSGNYLRKKLRAVKNFFFLSDQLVIHPLPADKSYGKKDIPTDPVNKHTKPYTGQTHVKLQHKKIR